MKTFQLKWAINDDQRAKRLTWSKAYIKMPDNYWFRVVFSDESKAQRNTKKEVRWVPKYNEMLRLLNNSIVFS